MNESQKILSQVYKEGLNVYQCLEQFRNEQKRVKAKIRTIPDHIIINVCKAYLANKRNIHSKFIWFITALENEFRKHNAACFLESHEKVKKYTHGEIMSIGKVMRKISRYGVSDL